MLVWFNHDCSVTYLVKVSFTKLKSFTYPITARKFSSNIVVSPLNNL